MHAYPVRSRFLPICVACLASLLAACSQETPAPPLDAAVDAAGDDAKAPPVTDLRQPAADSPPAPQMAAATVESTDAAVTATLEWDALIPADFRPETLLADLDLDNISDDDPGAQAAMDKIQALWEQAPVREELDGRTVRLPGFVVPLEADADETTGFLLVPYYGACIHVPPPPANQTVYVVTEPGEGAGTELFEVVWVTGTMSVKRIDNDIAEAGYTLYATDVAPYE
jgi:hypothetical protein